MRYSPAPRFSGSTPAKRTACVVPWNSGAKSLPWAASGASASSGSVAAGRWRTKPARSGSACWRRAARQPFPGPARRDGARRKHRHQQAEQRDRGQQLEQREAMLCRLPRATIAHSNGRPARSVVSVNCSAGLGPHVTVTPAPGRSQGSGAHSAARSVRPRCASACRSRSSPSAGPARSGTSTPTRASSDWASKVAAVTDRAPADWRSPVWMICASTPNASAKITSATRISSSVKPLVRPRS